MTYKEYLKKKRENEPEDISSYKNTGNGNDFTYEKYKQMRDNGQIRYDPEIVKDYFSQAQSLFSELPESGSSPTYDFASKGKDYSDRISGLAGGERYVNMYLNSIKGTPEYDQLSQQFSDYRNALSQTRDYLTNLTGFASQFDNEDDYNSAMTEINRRQKYQGKSYDELIKASNESEDEDEAKWLKDYANENASLEEITGKRDQALARQDEVNAQIRKYMDLERAADLPSDKQKYAALLDPLYAEADELTKELKQNGYDDLIKQKQAEAESKKYAEKYKGLDFNQLLSKISDKNSDAENEWLEKQADSVASSEQLRAKTEELAAEVKHVNNELGSGAFEGEEYTEKENQFKRASNALEKYKDLQIIKQREEKAAEYEKLANSPDFAELSKYKGSEVYNNAIETNFINTDDPDSMYRFVNSNVVDNKSASFLSKDEKEVFNYLYNSGKKDEAVDYLKNIDRRLNERRADSFREYFQDFATEHPWLASGVSLGSNLISGGGIVEDIGKRIVGEPIDTNSLMHLPAITTNTIRSTVSDKYLGDVGVFGYDTVMSAADSAVNMAISSAIGGAVGAVAGTAGSAAASAIAQKATSTTMSLVMGSQVATNTVIDAKERGLTDDQAVTLGVLYGIAETISEKYSIEHWMKDPVSIGSVLKKSFIAEGTEEVFANWLDRAADYLVSGDKSQINQKYKDYINQGFSDKEALTMTLFGMVGEDTTSFLAGGLSGVAMSGAHMALAGGVNEVQSAKAEHKSVNELLKPENKDALNKLIKAGKEFDKGSDNYKLAEKLEKASADGEKISAKDVKKLRRAVVQQAYKDTVEDVKKLYSVTEGMNDEQRATVGYLGDKLRRGQSLTKQENAMIRNDGEILKAVSSYIEKDENDVISLLDTAKFKDNFKYYSSNGNGLLEVDGNEFRGTVEIKSTNPANGKLTLNLIDDNGNSRTISSDDVDFKNDTEAKLYSIAANFSNPNEANAFVENYEGGDLTDYLTEWNLFSNYGRLGYNRDQIYQRSQLDTDTKVRQAAYYSGMEAFKSFAQAQYLNEQAYEAAAQSFKGYQRGSFVNNVSQARKKTMSQAQRNSIRELKMFTFAGLNVELFESKTDKNGNFIGENGSFDAKTKTLRVDINAGFANNDQAVKEAAKAYIRLTVGHELTHAAEQGGGYMKLRAEIIRTLEAAGFDYIRTDPNKEGLFDKKLKELKLQDKYKDLGQDELYRLADSEVIADCCETLLNDSKVFEKLFNADKTLAEKFINAVKRAIEKLRQFFKENPTYARTEYGKALQEAMSKVENRVQELWDEAVAQGIRAESKESGSKSEQFSIRTDIDGNKYVEVDPSIYDNTDGQSIASVIAKIISTRFNNLINANGQNIQINKTTNDEWRMSKSARFLQKSDTQAYNDKLRAIANADEILEIANNWVGEQLTHKRNDKIIEFARGNVLYKVGDNGYIADVIVGTKENGAAVLYDIKNIYSKKITEAPRVTKGESESNSLRTPSASVNNNIPQSTSKSNSSSQHNSDRFNDTDYLSAVERGDMATAQQMVDEAAEKAFPDSKARGEDGKLLRLYHGTKANFNVFDIIGHGGETGTAEGLGINLTDRKDVASAYGGRVIESYVNAKRLAKTWEKTITKSEIVKLIKKTAEAEAKQLFADDEYNSVSEALLDTWISNYVNTYEFWDINDAYKAVADAVLSYNENDRDIVWEVINGSGASQSNEQWVDFYNNVLTPTLGIDGFWIKWDTKDGKSADVIIAFDSSQVKSADPVTYDDSGNVIPLSERFNEAKEDIRYQDRYNEFDDLFDMGEDLFEDDSKREVLDELIEKYPDDALYIIKHAAEQTVENILTKTKSIKLDDDAYLYVARKFMREYNISRAANPEEDNYLAAKIKNIVARTEAGELAQSEIMNEFINTASDALMLSGTLDDSMKEEREFVLGLIKGKTLLVTDYNESNIRENYGDLTRYRSKLGHGYIALERNANKKLSGAKGVYIDEIISEIKEAYPSLIDDNANEATGFYWLERLLNDKLEPTFKSSTDSTAEIDAVNGGYEIMANLVDQKARQIARDNKNGQKYAQLGKTAREIAQEQRKAVKEAVSKAKEKERQKAKKDIKAAREKAEARYKAKLEKKEQQFKEKLDEQRNKTRELRHDKNKLIIAERQERINSKRKLRNNYERREYIDRIKKLAREFQQMAAKPGASKNIVPQNFSDGFYEVAIGITEAIKLSDNTAIGERLNTMVQLMRDLAEDDVYGSTFASEFTQVFRDQVNAFAEAIKGKKIDRNLTLEDAEQIYNILRAIKETVRTANKLLAENEGRTIKDVGLSIMAEQAALNVGKFRKNIKVIEKYFMTAQRLGLMFNGYNDNAALVKLVDNINRGQRQKNMFYMNANKMFDGYRAEHVKELDNTAKNVRAIKWKDNTGAVRTTNMTGMQAMQIVMTWNREVADDKLVHMQKGGLTIADPELLAKGKTGKAIENATRIMGINQSFITAVASSLTEFEKGYIDIAERFFNELAKDAVNETSLKLHHIKIANSRYYVPIKVDKDSLVKEIDGIKHDSSIESMGILQAINPNSSKPIYIYGLDSLINGHISDVSNYYGLAVPIRDMNKVLNVQDNQFDEDGVVSSANSVKQALKDNWGKQAIKTYEQMLIDLQNSRAPKGEGNSAELNNLIRTLRANFVTSTLNGNVSVVLKQAASYTTAGAYLSGGSLTVGLKDFAAHNVGPGRLQKLFDEIDSHTAQHYIRRKGLSSNEIADISQNWINKMLSNSKGGRALSTSWLGQKAPNGVNPNNWIQEMDCVTTAALWCATKAEVSKEFNKAHKEIDTNEYWQAVTDLYDKVIEDTQPMYDPLHRPEVLKVSNELLKSIFMFKTQPLQNAGIIYDALGRVTTDPKNKAAWKTLGKAVASQSSSLFVFSAMSLAVAFLLHRMKRYRDENDELTVQSVTGQLFEDMLINGTGVLLPFGGSEVMGSIFDGQDIVQDNVAETVKDFVSSGQNLVDTIKDTFENYQMGYGIDPENIASAFRDFAVLTGQDVFGIPVKNIGKNVDGVINWAKDLTDGDGQILAPENEPKNKQVAGRFARQIENGNTAEADKILDEYYNKEFEKARSNESVKNPKNKALQNTRDMLVNAYKTKYQKAFLKQDSKQMERIARVLIAGKKYMIWDNGKTSLSKKLDDWRKSAKEDLQKK